jgi:hypothetical protein
MSKATATPKAPRAKKSTDSSPAVARSPVKAPKAASTSTAKAAVPRARKAAAPSPAEVKSPAKSPKPVAARAKKPASAPLSDDLRRRYVSVAAYYIAERRGFQGRPSEADWFEAEEQIRLQFSANGSKP